MQVWHESSALEHHACTLYSPSQHAAHACNGRLSGMSTVCVHGYDDNGYLNCYGNESQAICPDHGFLNNNSMTVYYGSMPRGVDPGGWGVLTPLKICRRGQSMFYPLKMSHSFIQNCCCITAIFTASRMNSWTLSLHWSCLCWRCYHPYVWSAPRRQCPPINAFDAVVKVVWWSRGLTWRSHVGANPIPIPTPLIWRYLGVK